jgi:hypothetical protein
MEHENASIGIAYLKVEAHVSLKCYSCIPYYITSHTRIPQC